MDTQWMESSSRTLHHHQDGSPEILYDMISSGTHSSTERINKFMNSIYVNKPRAVSLFSFNYRQQTERSTIRGVSIGTNNRRGPAQKNVVLVSGLPLQEPSLIGVGLYVAAVLSRLSPALPRDVSVIPLANPKEYEKRWRAAQVKARIGESDLFSFSSPFSSSSLFEDSAAEANWISSENVTLELKDTCKPIETYITRKNKYFINLEVELTSRGSSMSYKGNSFTSLASKGKFRDFFASSSSPSLPLPSSLFPSSPSPSLLIPENNKNNNNTSYNKMLSSILQSPSIVLEMKGNQALDDEQVVARGEEIVSLLKELMVN